MRSLFRLALATTALSFSVVSAHATTYTATATLTDNTTAGNVTGSFAPINFSDPPHTSRSYDYGVVANQFANGDQLSLDFSFTSPGSGSGGIDGGTGISTLDLGFWGTYSTGGILWDTSSQTIDLSNGSVVTVTLPTDWKGNAVVGLGACDPFGDACGQSSFKLTVATNDPPTAAAPEPSSLILLGTGLLGSVGVMRRRFGC